MNPILALQADLPTLKAHLKMAYVMERYGHTPEIQDPDGRLHYLSPFREEEHPSFDIFANQIQGRDKPEERYGDFGDPNLAQGDVVDLITLFESCSIAQAMDTARTLLAEQLEEGWNGHTVERSEYRKLDMTEVQFYIDQGRPLSASQTWLLLPRTHPGLADVVLPSDRVFTHPQFDIIVFLLLDTDGEVRGVRHRSEDGSKYGLPGGHNILMRLEAPSQKPVFLTEGETDLWAAYGALGKDFEVLGVPGVGTTPKKAGADDLAGRTVYIAFDPDDAGERGRTAWAEYLSGIGCDVRTIVLPAGKDLAKLNREQITRLPDGARSLPAPPDDFARDGNEFVSISWQGRADDRTPVPSAKSNWSFIPHKILIAHDGTRAYQGELRPSGKTVVLPDAALTSSAQLKSWGAKYQARWFGSDPLVQKLAALLDHQAAYLPEGLVHNQVGLYQGSFVWPEGYIGTQAVEYMPTVAEASLGRDKIFLKFKPKVDRIKIFEALYNTQHHAVTGPMLAWLAAAPLRTRFHHDIDSPQFPYLSVTGVSGSGKSALVDMFLRVFSSTNLALTLSSTTPHAVSTMMDTSCGFPIWFDEYRPGARVTAKETLDQLLREAYTHQEASKGGQDRANLSRLTSIRTMAPTIVSGEDNFTEESHAERLVAVRLIHSEQGNLGTLKDLDTTGFGYAYLKFLTETQDHGLDQHTPVWDNPVLSVPSGFNVKDRPERNLRVLQYGWQQLTDFLQAADPTYEMPELDLSRVVDQYHESATENPVLDLIKVCLENDTLHETAWTWGEFLCVSPQNLIDEAKHHPSITLPTSSAAGIRKLLSDKYGTGGTENTPVPGVMQRRIKAIRIPWDALDWDNDEQEET